jgi:hypothetical protein
MASRDSKWKIHHSPAISAGGGRLRIDDGRWKGRMMMGRIIMGKMPKTSFCPQLFCL